MRKYQLIINYHDYCNDSIYMFSSMQELLKFLSQQLNEDNIFDNVDWHYVIHTFN